VGSSAASTQTAGTVGGCCQLKLAHRAKDYRQNRVATKYSAFVTERPTLSFQCPAGTGGSIGPDEHPLQRRRLQDPYRAPESGSRLQHGPEQRDRNPLRLQACRQPIVGFRHVGFRLRLNVRASDRADNSGGGADTATSQCLRFSASTAIPEPRSRARAQPPGIRVRRRPTRPSLL